MTCEEARTLNLRGLADVPSVEAREHLAGCAPCADYASDAEVLWDVAASASERCPERRRRWKSTAAAAALIVAATAWAAWPRDEAARPAAQDIEEKVRKVALREKELLAEFEARLAAVEKGFAELAGLGLKEEVERAEALLADFPGLKLAVLDVPELDYKARILLLKLKIRAGEGRLKLLPDEPLEQEERAAAEINLANRLREHRRQMEEAVAQGPRPRTAELGGPAPNPREATLAKVRSIKITIDVQGSVIEDSIAYLREISGLAIVFRGPKEARAVKVTLDLRDATMEAVLEHLATAAGFTWEVDRFGILVLTSAKR